MSESVPAGWSCATPAVGVVTQFGFSNTFQLDVEATLGSVTPPPPPPSNGCDSTGTSTGDDKCKDDSTDKSKNDSTDHSNDTTTVSSKDNSSDSSAGADRNRL